MNKQKILIVEDSKPILQIHTHLVRKAGFEPVTAETLAQVYALKDQLPKFFLAIIDYSLPDAPNGEAISYLLENHVPGIVMTGMLDDNIRDNILKQPVIDYITKESKQAYTYLHHLIEKLRTNNQVKVLVVDDSTNSRNYLKRLLERHYYQVLLATCGEKALEVLEQHQDIKLIITDKEMPNMDGLELCNRVRANFSKDEISIIGVSGADNPSLTAKFIKNGANDFLKKPFCPEEFYCRTLQNIEYIESIETIRRQANTDYLTGLYNRRFFFEQVNPIIKQRKESGNCSTLAMLDIDHFKSINDNYGHEAGDDVLKSTASLMDKYFESYTVARIGGEEFCIWFDETSLTVAEQQLNAFRQELEQTAIYSAEGHIKCTISAGVVFSCEISLDALLNKADELLYKAKEQGRNQVVSG
ncbi:MAG: diguanylate cyclase [Gammaproteobacteria bacterium]|nr:diguanylate cyclase [Gammaproteobacteria bacterium]